MRIVKTPNTKEKDIYIITIVADSNDGDYITTNTHLSEESFNNALPALEYLLENCVGRLKLEEYYDNGDNSPDYIDIDEYFDIPFGEMGCCHTIEDVSIMFYEKNGMSYVVTLEDD